MRESLYVLDNDYYWSISLYAMLLEKIEESVEGFFEDYLVGLSKLVKG